MEQPTTSVKAVGTGSTTSLLSLPFLELSEDLGWGGVANQGWDHRVWWQAKGRGGEGKNKPI